MNCDDFEKRIHRLLDHRVFVTRDKSLVRHAEVCRHCRSTLEAYADLDAGLAVWEAPQLDDDFARRVVAAVEPARPVTRAPFARLTIAAVAAGLLVALFPAVRNAFISSAPQPPSPVAAMPTPGPEVATPEHLPLAALALLPPDFLGVPSAFVRQPFGDMWQEWATTLARGRQEILEPMDGIRDGLRPITTTLTGTIDALRNAIPLGVGGQSEEASGDSASVPRGQSAGPAV
jgi:hypothetical protein